MRQDRTLAAAWPEHLIERIAANDFVLLVGAGVSRACSNSRGEQPPSWDKLLEKLILKFTSGAARKAAQAALEARDFLGAAELVRSKVRAAGLDHDYMKLIAAETDGGPKADSQFQPVALHETLLRLDPGIIVTTNYDRIFERASNHGYSVHSFDSKDLGFDLRQGTPVLVKIHGGVDHSPQLILTRSDYSRLRREGARALEALQALLLTRMVLFVGYSFSDPDIHLLLENVLGATGDPPSHYILTGSGTPTHVREVYRYSYGTSLIEFKAGDYAEMHRMLELLADEVELRRGLRVA